MPCEQVRMNGRILDPIPSPTPILFRPVKAVYGDSESTRVEGQEGEVRFGESQEGQGLRCVDRACERDRGVLFDR